MTPATSGAAAYTAIAHRGESVASGPAMAIGVATALIVLALLYVFGGRGA